MSEGGETLNKDKKPESKRRGKTCSKLFLGRVFCQDMLPEGTMGDEDKLNTVFNNSQSRVNPCQEGKMTHIHNI